MAHVPAELQKKMEAAMPADVVWRFRPMFGGIGVYANDKMCVSLSDVGLAVKLSGDAHAELLKLKGAKPLQYEPGAPVSKTYVVVPDAMLADRRKLGHWLALAASQAGSKSADSGKKQTKARRRRAPT
ncbi:MAG: TfoX/Sxy family protein [Proteobacteria bacterium]|nr:TfoX/Sxy family protein [Pseudomonadota bacterium]